MARYTVARRYQSYRDGQQFGPWPVGSEAELSEADADWVNRDSPGCLVPVASAAPEPEPAPAAPEAPAPEPAAEVEPERAARPARDRQHRGGRTRGA